MFKNVFAILLFCLLLTSCAQESRTPANFKLKLGGVTAATASDFTGGLILMGSNGSERFSVGLSPQEIENYSIELPSGNWDFRAVAWLGDTGLSVSPAMTGPSRCAYTTAKIEDENTTIEMALSKDKCYDGVVADVTSQDTDLYDRFKQLSVESCLTTAGISTAAPCDGSALNNMPGESSSVRIVFPSSSNFGASVGPLVSACWNHVGYANEQFLDGNIPTQVRLPFGGQRAIPFHIVAFEEKNCQSRNSVYRMIDGVDGTQGVARLYQPSMTNIKLYIADNFIGHEASAFVDTASDLLPSLACHPNCYPSTSGLPRDPGAGLKENFKESFWRYIGNGKGYTVHNIHGTTQAMLDTGEIMVYTDQEIGGLKNGVTFQFTNSSVDPVSISCGTNIINIDYTAGTHSVEDIKMGLDSLFCDGVQYFTDIIGDANADFMFEGGPMLMNGNQEIRIERPERGLFEKVKRLLAGPIGAGLHKAGVQTRQDICDGSMDGDYGFTLDSDPVTIRLETPSGLAAMPKFETGYMNTSFERKITVFMSGVPEEAFYFNCTDDVGVGAYFSDETIDNNHPRKVQLFWDTSTQGFEAVEVASERYDSSNSVTDRNWFLFKGQEAGGNFHNVWSLNANINQNYFSRSTGYVDRTVDSFYVQGEDVTQTDIEQSFSVLANDSKYEISTDLYLGIDASTTEEPGTLFPNMGMTPNFMSGYSFEDLNNDGFSFYDINN